ncbi:FecR family protein [Flectobacillus roseus]|uniref:FecR family protein n=1 Tax=Flectobacillus roseus TaxID=502259 RepID=UPI0024B69EA1|nr:FecR domain-containing protein [Flectobacillus roseus]MDI9870309.1 FecR domain-containing protein [Flectobacillus roseus]
MISKEQERILQEYLSGKESPEGKALFDQWAQSLYEDKSFQPSDSEEALSKAQQKMWVNISSKKDTPIIRLATSWALRAGIAASVLLISMLAWKWIGKYNQPLPEYELSYQTIKTKAGEHATVTLEDGSKLFLNGASSLRFPTKLQGQTRHVYLEGEAYFEVTHNPQQPFIVSSKHLNTTVKGTTFDVHDYTQDNQANVTVLTGKVAVEMANNPQRNCLILPNQVCTYQSEKANLSQSSIIDARESINWRERKVYFKRERMGLVFRKLERMYEVSFQVENPQLMDCTWIASFENASLEEVLQLMQSSLGIQYQIKGKEVIIKGICQ